MTRLHRALLAFLVLHTGNCVLNQNVYVRLIPGPDKGRLEVFYDNIWGTVCQSSSDSRINNRVASVVCRILKQPTYNSYCVSGKKYSAGALKARLDTIACSGGETSLSDCTLTPIGNSICKSPDDVIGIECTNATMQAVIRSGNRWYESVQRIYAFQGYGIGCYAGTDTHIRGFTCSLRSKDGIVTELDSAGFVLKRSETGPLTCTVSNWQVPDQDTLTLDLVVLYAPTVLCQQQYMFKEGSTGNVTCKIYAYPPPFLYIWTDSTDKVISQGSHPSLFIPSIGSENTGQYMLTVYNKMQASYGRSVNGTAQATFIITVEGDGVTRTISTPASSPHRQSLSTVTYAVIAVLFVSLVAVFVLLAVVIKMLKTKARTAEPQQRDDTLTPVTREGQQSEHIAPDRSSQRSSTNPYLHVEDVPSPVSDGLRRSGCEDPLESGPTLRLLQRLCFSIVRNQTTIVGVI